MIQLPSYEQSIFTKMSALAVKHQAINLGQGIPEDPVPEAVMTAAIEAMKRGQNQYSPSPGLPELRREIALSCAGGVQYDPDDVTVFCGGIEALSAAVLALMSPGDRILAFEPYFDSYPAFAAMAGAQLVPVPLHDDGESFRLDVGTLRRKILPRSRFLLLNSPHNPTGHVFDEQELKAIAEIVLENDMVVISDEVYEHFTYGVPHVSIATLPGMRERTVVISSASKTFSITGWRIGWALADQRFTQKMRAVHSFLTFCAATPLQLGVAAGLRLLRESNYVADLQVTFCNRRDCLLQGLRRAGFDPIVPKGAFFITTRLGRWKPEGLVAFAEQLTILGGITSLPLVSFFSDSEKAQLYLRFAFCRPDKMVVEAGERLVRFARQYQQAGQNVLDSLTTQ